MMTKTPDKIYVAFKDGFVAQTANTDKDAEGNSVFVDGLEPVEFVRKDALLRWLREKVKLTWRRPEDIDEVADKVSAYQEMIDKLNQL